MAQYLLVIYSDEKLYAEGGQGIWDDMMKGHAAFGDTYASKIVGGNALQSATTATSVRQDRDGNVTVTDGPFVETKEALGGYYVVEAEDLDEAITMAKAIPAPGAGVEVRPVMVFD